MLFCYSLYQETAVLHNWFLPPLSSLSPFLHLFFKFPSFSSFLSLPSLYPSGISSSSFCVPDSLKLLTVYQEKTPPPKETPKCKIPEPGLQQWAAITTRTDFLLRQTGQLLSRRCHKALLHFRFHNQAACRGSTMLSEEGTHIYV